MSAAQEMQQRGAILVAKSNECSPLAAAHEIPAQAGRRGANGFSKPTRMTLPADTDEIGLPETVVRRRGAIAGTKSNEHALPADTMPVETRAKRQGATPAPKPTRRSPLVATDPAARQVKRGRATQVAKPREPAPSPAPVPAETPVRRKAKVPTNPKPAAPSADSIAATCAEIVSLQRLRRFCIVSQSRCDRSIESLIASRMGFRIDATEKDRKQVFARAKAYRERVEKGGEGQPGSETQASVALSALDSVILLSAASRKSWDDQREAYEKEMRRLAMTLPVWPFAKAVRGLGELGLARLIGEAGIPIGDYRTASGLWKRLGLAVINGERQRKKTDKDEAAEHGYSPKRRAEAWSVCSDSLFRQQWRGADEETGLPARPIGPYGEVYAKRRAHTECRIAATEHMDAKNPAKWSKGRCHNDARRVMTKRLLLDLWLAWRNEPFVAFELRQAA